MPVLTLVFAGFVLGFEQLVEWQFGAIGVIGLLLLTIGVKAQNATCSCIGAVVLAMLLVHP